MSIAACAALVERGDPDRFRAIMAAPPGLRASLFPLHAFALEVSRAPWVTKEPMIAEMRLQWWRDVIEGAAGSAQARAHEVAGPLHDLIREKHLPVTVLDRMVEARRWDINRDPFEDQADFDSYLEDTAAGLLWLAARSVGAPDGAEAPVRALGWAAGLAGFLAAVPELEARGRVPLVDGRPEAVAALARQGLARIAQARTGRGSVPALVRPALLTAFQAPGLLRLAASDPMAVAEGRLQLSEFAKRGGLLWKSLTGRY